MGTRTRDGDCVEYETMRLLDIGGNYYAFQQQYELVYAAKSAREGGVGSVKMPTGEHRLVPLEELVDVEEVAGEVLGSEPVDKMVDL